MKISKILPMPLLLLALSNKCVYQEEVLPSYGGVYEFDAKATKYLGLGSQELRQNNPLTIDMPKYLAVFQRHYKEAGTRTLQYSAFTVDEDNLNKESLLEGLFDEDSLAPNGVFISLDQIVKFKKQVSEKYRFTDENSEWLGWEAGFACQYEVAGNVSFELTPDGNALLAAYPNCTMDEATGLCLAPMKSWTEIDINKEAWVGQVPVLKVKYKAYKEVPGTGYKAACGEDDQSFEIEVTYKRVHALNMGDLRVKDDDHENKITNWLKTLPSVSAFAFGATDDAEDLWDLFPEARYTIGLE